MVAGSFSIIFDGAYSLIDASMSLLSLIVVNLINSYAASEGLSRKLRDRFSMGFWHLEPLVLGLNGVLLMSVAVYALFNAVSSMLTGGRELEFGLAIIYAIITLAVCSTLAIIESRANRHIKSEFLRLDVQGWIMAAGITAALLVAFVIGYLVQGSDLEWISPYIDPTVLALVCLVIIPMPLPTVRKAIADVFMVTPADMKQRVDQVAQAFVEKHGLLSYRAYVARVGRSRVIELYFIVPAHWTAKTIGEWDALREEAGEAIGDSGPHRWITIVFTGDAEWAD